MMKRRELSSPDGLFLAIYTVAVPVGLSGTTLGCLIDKVSRIEVIANTTRQHLFNSLKIWQHTKKKKSIDMLENFY